MVRVAMLEILLPIQFQGGNNLTDLMTPKTVWVEKLGTIFIKGNVHHYLAFSIGLPYATYVFRVFHKNWGCNCVDCGSTCLL